MKGEKDGNLVKYRPYQCLLDFNRTKAFQAAIGAVVKEGAIVLTAETRLIPFRYEAFIELGFTNFNYYGFKIFAPKQDWPHYSCRDNGWLPTEFHALSHPHRLGSIDFQQPIDNRIDTSLLIKAKNNGVINAVRISASAHLASGASVKEQR